MESQIVTGKSKPKLPIEIILSIIESFAPQEKRPILPPSHLTTRSLVSFTRVCKATYPTAAKLLWQFCLYIDSRQRAHDFLRFLSSPPSSTRWQTRGPARLFLSPFPETPDHDPEDSDSGSAESANLEDDSSSTSSLPRWSPLNDLPTAQAVHDILITLAPILKVLIIDMPLRSLYPDSDKQGVRPILRHGFEALTNIEDFVSVRDELNLSTKEKSAEVWTTCWPKLRRLAIYNPDVDPDDGFWRDMALLPTLEVVVFTRADPGRDLSDINIKQEWQDAVIVATSEGTATDHQPKRELTVAFVDCPSELPDFTNHFSDWQARDPENRIRVLTKGVHPPPGEGYGEDLSQWPISPIDICQSWIKQHALDGTLWGVVCSDDSTPRE